MHPVQKGKKLCSISKAKRLSRDVITTWFVYLAYLLRHGLALYESTHIDWYHSSVLVYKLCAQNGCGYGHNHNDKFWIIIIWTWALSNFLTDAFLYAIPLFPPCHAITAIKSDFTRIRQRGSVSLSPCGHTFYQFYFTSCINISVVQILNVLSNFKFAGVLCELLRLFCVNSDSNATFHFYPDR